MLSCVSSRLEWASHLHSEVKKHDKAASSAFKAEWNLRQGSAHLSPGLIAGTAEVVTLSFLTLSSQLSLCHLFSLVTVTMVLLWSIKKRKGWKRRISLWLAGSPWGEKTSIALRWNNFSSVRSEVSVSPRDPCWTISDRPDWAKELHVDKSQMPSTGLMPPWCSSSWC